MDIKKDIRSLRIIAFLLFLTPAIGLLGSLIIHNYLVTFSFIKGYNYGFKKNEVGEKFLILCSEQNNYCYDKWTFIQNKKLNECNKYTVIGRYITDSEKELKIDRKDIKNYGKKIYVKYEISNQLNQNCILNHNIINLYNLIPSFFEKVYKIKNTPSVNLATSVAVNPLLYGETSISNIVKRNPIKFIFKPLLFISVILMFLYWYLNNKILNKLLNQQKNYYFYIFGILSALFLFLHIFFLGWTFESNFLTKLRRVHIVFFILFEILAQTFLIKKLFQMKDQLKDYLNLIIIYIKLIFIFIVCGITIVILSILIFSDLTSRVDYIIEWNYFLLLLLFYLLSSLMWKKSINQT